MVTNVEFKDLVSAPEPIRQLTQRAFIRRFTLDERIAVRASTDPIVVDIYEDLRISTNIHLDYEDLHASVAYLVNIGILAQDRIDVLLADGTEEEKYRGEYVGIQ